MKKLVLVFGLILCFTSANAQIIQNTTRSFKDALGIKKTGDNRVVNSENSVNDQGETIYKESKFTATVDFLTFTLLNSMGGRQFSTESFIVGSMWKLDEHWQVVFEWENLKTESMDDVEYLATHYLFGCGIRWYLGDGVQAQLNAGVGSSTIVRKEDGKKNTIGDLEMPAFGEGKVLWVSDNTGYGFKIQFLDLPNKAEKESEMRNYGHVIVSASFEIGFSGLAGLVR